MSCAVVKQEKYKCNCRNNEIECNTKLVVETKNWKFSQEKDVIKIQSKFRY